MRRQKRSQGTVYSFFFCAEQFHAVGITTPAYLTPPTDDDDVGGFSPSEKKIRSQSGENGKVISLSGDAMNRGGFTLNRKIEVTK